MYIDYFELSLKLQSGPLLVIYFEIMLTNWTNDPPPKPLNNG